MNFCSPKDIYGCFNEICMHDTYGFYKYPYNFFDVILDIGANCGVFSVLAKFSNPKCKLIAIEPGKDTYQKLKSNLELFPNTTIDNSALGDGSSLYFFDGNASYCNLFYKENENTLQQNTYKVDSFTLPTIFQKYDIDIDKMKYFIKMDCEGGERFLLNDTKCEEIIRKSIQLSIEVHFSNSKNPRFKTFPKWEEYNDWINKNFQNTHSILYHHSNRKLGHGTYVISKK